MARSSDVSGGRALSRRRRAAHVIHRAGLRQISLVRLRTRRRAAAPLASSAAARAATSSRWRAAIAAAAAGASHTAADFAGAVQSAAADAGVADVFDAVETVAFGGSEAPVAAASESEDTEVVSDAGFRPLGRGVLLVAAAAACLL